MEHSKCEAVNACFNEEVPDIVPEKPGEAALQAQQEAKYRQRVLDSFFEYGKLKTIPAQRKKERIILEELVKAFAPGRLYTEREVNSIISGYHDDFCTLRRDMVDEKLLGRSREGYWRIVPEDKNSI